MTIESTLKPFTKSTAELAVRNDAGRRRVGELRQRAGRRLAIRHDAEELLEIDEERIFARAGEHLNAGRRCRGSG